MQIKGVQEVTAELKRLAKKYPGATAAALYTEGQAIESASVPLVPVDTGRLRATHYTSPPMHSAGNSQIEVQVGYGTDYALSVHERMRDHHKVGQAKYLEVPFKAAMRGFASRLAARIKANMERGVVFVSVSAGRKG